MTNTPKTSKENAPSWEKTFPIARDHESRVSRREAIAFMGIAGVCCGFGRFLPNGDRAANLGDEPIDLGPAPDLAPSQSATFQVNGIPILVIRLPDGRLKAYDSRCTHLLCPVHYDDSKDQIVCPCHHGYFSADEGRPLAGPPRERLREYAVRIDGGRLYLAESEGRVSVSGVIPGGVAQ